MEKWLNNIKKNGLVSYNAHFHKFLSKGEVHWHDSMSYISFYKGGIKGMFPTCDKFVKIRAEQESAHGSMDNRRESMTPT